MDANVVYGKLCDLEWNHKGVDANVLHGIACYLEWNYMGVHANVLRGIPCYLELNYMGMFVSVLYGMPCNLEWNYKGMYVYVLYGMPCNLEWNHKGVYVNVFVANHIIWNEIIRVWMRRYQCIRIYLGYCRARVKWNSHDFNTRSASILNGLICSKPVNRSRNQDSQNFLRKPVYFCNQYCVCWC